jgi:hypothetical protein
MQPKPSKAVSRCSKRNVFHTLPEGGNNLNYQLQVKDGTILSKYDWAVILS